MQIVEYKMYCLIQVQLLTVQVHDPLGVASHETDDCKKCSTNQPTSLGTQSQGCPRKFSVENLNYFLSMQILF